MSEHCLTLLNGLNARSVLASYQQRNETIAIVSQEIAAGETWDVPPPGPHGMWVSFADLEGVQLASTIAREGHGTQVTFSRTTPYEVVINGYDPTRKHFFVANQTSSRVVVDWEVKESGQLNSQPLDAGKDMLIEHPPYVGVWVAFLKDDGHVISALSAQAGISGLKLYSTEPVYFATQV